MANIAAGMGSILDYEDQAKLALLLNALKGQQATADWQGQGAAGGALQSALMGGGGAGAPSPPPPPAISPQPSPTTQMGSAGPMSVPTPNIQTISPPPAAAPPPQMAGQGAPQDPGLTSAKLDWRQLAQAITQKHPDISGQAFMAAMDRLAPIMSTQSKAEWELQKAQLAAQARIYGADASAGARDYAADKGASSRVEAANIGAGSREDVARTVAGSRESVANTGAAAKVQAAKIGADARVQSAVMKQKVDQLAGKMTDVQKTKARALIQEMNRSDVDMNTLLAGGITDGDAYDAALARRQAAASKLDGFLKDVEKEGQANAPASAAPPALPPGQPQGVEGVGNQPLGKVLTFNPATGNLE